MEYKLLCYLARNMNRIVAKEELFAEVWEMLLPQNTATRRWLPAGGFAVKTSGLIRGPACWM
ncbi:winged helix-turn-helix domain-containing protein [Paenibacillus riograndensis]|uniref:winged helix-turn-helix domain-containing protein n=1 Tax=Paenibacillus riograndensis TaxID=483937 RepID=UPI001E507A35|nr:winged helix-turn-helix domain-containing protein [Paenibacillus riograndensis]